MTTDRQIGRKLSFTLTVEGKSDSQEAEITMSFSPGLNSEAGSAWNGSRLGELVFDLMQTVKQSNAPKEQEAHHEQE